MRTASAGPTPGNRSNSLMLAVLILVLPPAADVEGAAGMASVVVGVVGAVVGAVVGLASPSSPSAKVAPSFFHT